MIIYRAADSGELAEGQCFARDSDDAREYLDNPGYGGARLWALEAGETSVVEIDGWTDLAAALIEAAAELDEDELDELDPPHWMCDDAADLSWRLREYGAYPYELVEGLAWVAELLATRWAWAEYEDTYPAGCMTLMALRAPQGEMTEIDRRSS